jgi:hypothetical protein
VQAGSGQEKAHRLEVRRRNGRRKAARTLADRILVLTETERRNPGGFVAFEARFREPFDAPRAASCGLPGNGVKIEAQLEFLVDARFEGIASGTL